MPTLTKKQKIAALLDEILADGFDRSRLSDEGLSVIPACSQCETCVINGHACHETGCPNAARVARERAAADREDDDEGYDDFEGAFPDEDDDG